MYLSRCGSTTAQTSLATPVPAPEPDQSRLVDRLRAGGCVFAEDEARLLVAAAHSAADLDAMLDRRLAGVPLEHLLGWAEFCGRRIAVDPGVFVPRRRTEFLVESAVRVLHERHRHAATTSPPLVVDLCCGTGAVGALVADACEPVVLHAVDLDPAAIRCAHRNLADAGTVYEGDLFDPLPKALRGRVDLVVANAPYVPTTEIVMMPAEARVHEASIALDGGPDGVDIHRRIADAAPQWLAAGGRVLIETSRRQAGKTADALSRNGFSTRVETSERLEATVVIGANSGG
jgi:release factor glutamine methyltransferase